MKKVTPQPIFGRDVPDSVLRLCREYSESLNQLADHRFSEFVQVSGSYTAGENDHVIECSPSGAMTVTLPAASVMRNKRVVVKRANNTTHTITIQSTSGTIDDAASVTLTTAYQSREVFSDGVEWWLLDVDAGPPTDPYWGQVILLLNGSSTPTKDSSSYNRTLGNTGSVILDSSVQLFGVDTYRIQSGVTDYISIADDSFIATAAGAGEWCFEMHCNVTDEGSSDNRFALYKNFIWRCINTGNFSVSCTAIGGSSYTLTQTDNSAPYGSFYHVRLIRDNTTDATFTLLRLFVDGVEKASIGGISKAATLGAGTSFGRLIGVNSGDAYGWFTNKRLTVGTCRDYANFTPPSAPYPTS